MNVNQDLEAFCKDWLSAWTGNNPTELIKFYDEDAYYQDPANIHGLKGHRVILNYFKKLLASNPNWIWEVEELYPTVKGFVLKWKATIPVGEEEVLEYGMDIVEMKKGKITRNEVFFDRTKLISTQKKITRT
ncbi:MAG: nuclear transport factor 2 family protein [Candidatus Heimdallarchaeota archaeon]|nr:nuclear transport factor 2 family protein [Candidatus Heimdallarchaeota archaeon]